MKKVTVEKSEYLESDVTNDANTIIKIGVTEKSLENAKRVIGNRTIRSITHTRNRGKIEYRTHIIFDDIDDLLIVGGITSGYVGTGTNGFKELLIYTGVSSDVAEDIAHDTKHDKLKITIKFS